MSLLGKVDVLIIGARIIGASCAFRLNERGVTVTELEAQNAPAMGQWAVVPPEYETTSEHTLRRWALQRG